MKNSKLIITILFLVFAIKLNAQITGTITADSDKTKYLANTVVYIEKAEGTFTVPTKNPIINQKNLTFIPHVLPVLVGTTVDFTNNDNVLHNVFSPDACAGKFDLGSWKQGVSKSQKFSSVGCESVILCNIHPEMEAYVVVLQNPYFAITDDKGNFTISNVPAGSYNLKVWNEAMTATDQKITVPASKKLTVTFKLKK